MNLGSKGNSKRERKRKAQHENPIVVDDEEDVQDVQDVQDVTLKVPYESGLINTDFAIDDYTLSSDDSEESAVYVSFLRGTTDTFIGTMVNRSGIVAHRGGKIF